MAEGVSFKRVIYASMLRRFAMSPRVVLLLSISKTIISLTFSIETLSISNLPMTFSSSPLRVTNDTLSLAKKLEGDV